MCCQKLVSHGNRHHPLKTCLKLRTHMAAVGGIWSEGKYETLLSFCLLALVPLGRHKAGFPPGKDQPLAEQCEGVTGAMEHPGAVSEQQWSRISQQEPDYAALVSTRRQFLRV